MERGEIVYQKEDCGLWLLMCTCMPAWEKLAFRFYLLKKLQIRMNDLKLKLNNFSLKVNHATLFRKMNKC